MDAGAMGQVGFPAAEQAQRIVQAQGGHFFGRREQLGQQLVGALQDAGRGSDQAGFLRIVQTTGRLQNRLVTKHVVATGRKPRGGRGIAYHHDLLHAFHAQGGLDDRRRQVMPVSN